MSSREEELRKAVSQESKAFESFYLWLQKQMPPAFFEEIGEANLLLVTHNLMSFHLQEYFSVIHLKDSAIVLCLDSLDADLAILQTFSLYGIRYYRTFVSKEPPPFPGVKERLRIGLLLFTEGNEKPLPDERRKEILSQLTGKIPSVTPKELETLLSEISPRFLRSMPTERLTSAIEMYYLAKPRDICQYQVRYNEDWKEKESPSMQIVLAWRNVPKYQFLQRLAETILRHNLALQKMVATYVKAYSTESVLILSLGLHGKHNKAAWEEADIDDFLQELLTMKYFFPNEKIQKTFVATHLIRTNMANFLEAMIAFVHQILLQADPHFYSLDNVEESFLRHPELTSKLLSLFEIKFHPKGQSRGEYGPKREELLRLIDQLDTGQAIYDLRRKNVLKQGLNFIDHILKTNFYVLVKTAFSFRLDPAFMDHVPYDRKEKFPVIPYGIFFIKNSYFTAFHIRFKDLARGGLRTIITQRQEQYLGETNNVFTECYNLALTQQKKNKDIPEGGSKAVILLEPFQIMENEWKIYQNEMKNTGQEVGIEKKVEEYKKLHTWEYLYQAQRSFIGNFLTLVNCNEDGTLKAKDVVDYYKRPEYIYLGPDENMFNTMIEWIAFHSAKHGYKPGTSFITSKPTFGINHKEYGVTSLGVTMYMHQVLLSLGINPEKDPFTIKISGGPDGDVAGNMLLNLKKFYGKTAKVLALTDVSGTIYDPNGLDLEAMANLFKNAQAIRSYPPEKLSEGGFLLDLQSKKEESAYVQLTKCYRKKGGKLVEDWLSGNEMNHLYRNNVHQTKTDIFIPCGGRPRTLNEHNFQDFLDAAGKPTSKAIVEGANLYLTPKARKALEKLGVIIIKDSSANKGGVICSSFEVLSTLTLDKEEFLKEKPQLVKEILEIIKKAALNEAKLLLDTFHKTGEFVTDISDKVSEKINLYKYQILDHLQDMQLPKDENDPLIKCLFLYAPPLIREKYKERLLTRIPDIHKKAIIACFIASHLVYQRGLDWAPHISDILEAIAKDLTDKA